VNIETVKNADNRRGTETQRVEEEAPRWGLKGLEDYMD
jgi:hypothetical protein